MQFIGLLILLIIFLFCSTIILILLLSKQYDKNVKDNVESVSMINYYDEKARKWFSAYKEIIEDRNSWIDIYDRDMIKFDILKKYLLTQPPSLHDMYEAGLTEEEQIIMISIFDERKNDES